MWLTRTMFIVAMLAMVSIIAHATNVKKIQLLGIEPNAGPLSGNTRVLVRGVQFEGMDTLFPHPKCKFGRDDKVVEAAYIKCTPEPRKVWEMEPPTSAKTATCLQCENAPPGFKAEIVPFTVTLSGDFSDIENSLSYRYYKDVKVNAIYPRYGEKDGGTRVDIWGENFLNFEQFTRCGFGSKSVPAVFVNSNYMYCFSPASDVVEKGIPFSVTLNAQQNSKEGLNFWYYNKPSIQSISPTRGPDDGGNEVVITGNNFDPFRLYDINNHNDTFCKFEGLSLMPATVHESTKISCNAPPSYVNRHANVEITLNNQQFTDDNQVYSYYKPPYLFDMEPRQGPTEGNTNVTIVGTNFKENTPFRCKFGNTIVEGHFISKHKLTCISPPHKPAEFVSLSVAFEQDLWSSGQNKFLYYDQPSIKKIEPSCGPETGYTQITVYGENFINLGIGSVHCVFNRTIHMNATVMEHDIIKCDSPPAYGWYKTDTKGPRFYYLEITLDGNLYGGPPQKFSYYKDPEITGITPILGPIEGGTEVTISGVGFDQPATCNMTVRFGNIYAQPSTYNGYEVKVRTPSVKVADAVVVAVGLNGQQFTKDKTLRFKDVENTFYYYENPTIYDFSPDKGLSNGGTLIKIRGRGFLPKKYENGTFEVTPVYARMLEAGSRRPLGPTTKAEKVENEEVQWKAPPAQAGTKGIISLSLNNHQFYELYHTNTDYSFEYLSSPFVTSIDPEFGEVRHSDQVTIDVHGSNFDCPAEGCNNVKCKFGTDPDAVVVIGQRQSSSLIKCPLPNYPQPDVLDVEVSMNGKDYSNNGKQFGYYDPFVISVEPKLISRTGSTRVSVKGFGFVDSTKVGGLKVLYDNDAGNYYCTNSQNKCVVNADYVDKHKVSAPTLPIDMLKYESGTVIEDSDPVNVEVSVFNDKFTRNHIKVHYYDDPDFMSIMPDSAPANTQSPIMIATDFNLDVNNIDVLMENAEFKCRFMSKDGTEEIYTDGMAISHPFKVGADPTHVKCNTPVWPLAGRERETVKLDITSNGYDYHGNFDFLFTDRLEIYRVAPLSGPNEGNSDVKLVGSGFRGLEDVITKWGVHQKELMNKNQIQEYRGSNFADESDYVSSIESIMPIHQRTMEADKVYDSLHTGSPMIENWTKTHGGPIYLEVGSREDVDGASGDGLGKYAYTTSFAEYYYYKQPVVKNIHPHGGPIEGGTQIVVEGSDFQFLPEYGVVPYCQIGDKTVEASFESTVRIICPAPPGDNIDEKLPIRVSLNGEDFIETGKFFHYYQNSDIISISPTSGPNTGGTTIRVKGEHFSDLSNSNEFLCRFKPLNKDIPAKQIAARYFNQTTILCPSPGGFGNVDAVHVDLSFNGIDYTDSKKEFRYYNIITAHPRSGPADGVGENIRVRGQGFKDDGNVKCRLDNVEYPPNHITWDEISCPVLAAKQGKDFFGNVPFEVSVNGDDWHSFTGGFQYYEQPTVTSIFPKYGPNVGHGKIKFYGDKFRSDFQLSEVYCKVGEAYGKATVLDPKTMECEIDELPMSGTEEAFPAQVSLNNASWTPVNKNTMYTPYGIKYLTPNSGPSTGNTEITVHGSGFNNGGSPRCRFGVPGSYAIVNGRKLDHDTMTCVSPEQFTLPKQASYPFSVPFSIAFNNDEYDPWTQSAHRFRFYQQPVISNCSPKESEIGKIQEVYVHAASGNEFVQPIPIEDTKYSDYGIICKFGKYGETTGTLVNSTLIKCITPTIRERPESLDKDTVILSVAQNGQNFNEEQSQCDYTFTGTGSGTSFWPWIFALILILILLIALVLCIAAIVQRSNVDEPRRAQGAYVPREAPHVLNKRPRGVPTGPMEYDQYSRRDTGAGYNNMSRRSDFRGTDMYDPRGNRSYY